MKKNNNKKVYPPSHSNIIQSPSSQANVTEGMSIRPIFVASLGNTSPYENSLHSAGHVLIRSLHSLLCTQQQQPQFSRSKPLANGFVSVGPNFTLWQSPAYMNLSGPPLAKAWRTYLSTLSSDFDRRLARLVVLHDELESPLGRIKVKTGGMGGIRGERSSSSVKGHKGLKSVVEHLGVGGGGGTKELVRVGVGIGRPASREPEDVSRFVLRKMSLKEIEAVTEAAGEVLGILNTIREVEGGVPYTSPY